MILPYKYFGEAARFNIDRVNKSMEKTIGRNDPCHCGSGNKYKKCCLAKDTADIKTEFKAKYRFEAASYGGVGQYMPSIVCYKSAPTGEWSYHFVLVNLNHVGPEESQATVQADADLSSAFEVKNSGGTDADLAMNLKNKGYVSVENFNIIRSKEFQS
jgi:hypothetical protein